MTARLGSDLVPGVNAQIADAYVKRHGRKRPPSTHERRKAKRELRGVGFTITNHVFRPIRITRIPTEGVEPFTVDIGKLDGGAS